MFIFFETKKDHTTLTATFEFRKSSHRKFITLFIEYEDSIHSKVLTIDIKELFNVDFEVNYCLRTKFVRVGLVI